LAKKEKFYTYNFKLKYELIEVSLLLLNFADNFQKSKNNTLALLKNHQKQNAIKIWIG